MFESGNNRPKSENNRNRPAHCLRGRQADHVENERESPAYLQAENWVRNQWHAWLKKRNHDHEPQNPTEANLS